MTLTGANKREVTLAAALFASTRKHVLSLAALLGALALLVGGGLYLSQIETPPERPQVKLPPMPLEAGFPKWTRVMARTWALSEQHDSLCRDRLGRDCSLTSWQRFLDGLRDRPVLERITAVNDFINRVRYREDGDNWGIGDYWAAPGEFFASGGDCEDYAIAKYYSLRALGFPIERLKIVVLYDHRRELPHAVLSVTWNGDELILDNFGQSLSRWAEAPHYKPIYAVNETRFELLGLPPAKARRAQSRPVQSHRAETRQL